MNKLVFNNIKIIDLVNYESFSTNFIDGVNIITSNENSVGKSTILKSLYHTLGAEIKFGHRINIKNILFVLNFTLDNTNYTIMRNQNSYKIINPQDEIISFYNSKDLTNHLSTLFGFTIEIENANKKIEQAPPVFYYLPYYIDQNKGWVPDPESFENLSQFNKPKRDASIYFHLGVLGANYISLINKKEELTISKKDINNKLESTYNLLKIIEEELTTFDISISNTDALLIQKRLHLKKYEKYNYNADTIKRKLLEHKELLFQLEITLKNIDKSIKNEQKKKKEIQEKEIDVTCPNCSFEFEVKQANHFKINFNIEQLSAHKIELFEQRTKLINAIKLLENELYEFSLKLKEVEQIQVDNSNSLENIIKYKGLYSTKNKLSTNLKEHTERVSELEFELKKTTAAITKMNNQKKSTDKDYSYILEKYFQLFDITEFYIIDKNRKNYNLSKTFSSDGANQIKVNLAKFYATIELINKYEKGIILPIVIDSPKTGEQSFKNNKVTLDNLVYNISLNNQTVIATIDYQLDSKMKYGKLNKNKQGKKQYKLHKIRVIKLPEIEAQLLTKEDYQKDVVTYKKIIDMFTQSK